MTSPMCRAMQESQKKLVISKGEIIKINLEVFTNCP